MEKANDRRPMGLQTTGLLLAAVTAALAVLPTRGAAGQPADDRLAEGQAAPQVVSIGRMPKPPVLDGRLNDWPPDATVILLGQEAQTVRRAVRWSGTPDAACAIRLAWDDDYLYFAAEVSDDKPLQAQGGAEPWQGDSFELFFNTHPRQQRVDGFWQIAIVPPLKEGATLAVVCPQKDFEGVEGAAVLQGGGYSVECRIPWKNLTGFTPAMQEHLGFQVFLDDRDDKGRKSQLAWYPSAITFSRPAHTNVIILRDQGETTLPRVLAGPDTWCQADAKKMPLSVLADVAGAKKAIISPLPSGVAWTSLPMRPTAHTGVESQEKSQDRPGPATHGQDAHATSAPTTQPGRIPEPVTIDLVPAGQRITVGRSSMNIEGLDGLYNFQVTVLDEAGRTLAVNTFQAQMTGALYARINPASKSLGLRLAEQAKRPGVDPLAAAGLSQWLTRVNGFIGNEARPDTASRWLLEVMAEEFGQIADGADRLEANQDPYAGRTGSFVRAYTSPLTGNPRPLALLVPPEYDANNKEKKYPLIVLMHGIFADERQLAMMRSDFEGLGAIVVQAPAYRQFDWGGISAAETWAGLDEVKRLYPIDEDRVYLVGHHIGGRGVWQLAMARPDMWAAIAPLLWGIDSAPAFPALRLYPQFFPQATNVQIPPPQFKMPATPAPIDQPLEKKMYELASLATRIGNVAHLPIQAAYGEDNPDAAAERLAMEQRLTELGVPLACRYIPEAMHGSTPPELHDRDFYRWLLSHKRPAKYKEFSFTTNSLRYDRAWCVEIVQVISPAEMATVEGRVDGNGLDVRTKNVSSLVIAPDPRLAIEGNQVAVSVDGQPVGVIGKGDWQELELGREWDGKWHGLNGISPTGLVHGKQMSLSGPIDDFQFRRFMFVYGTGGDANENAAAEKRARRMADWGLGAVFEVKADSNVTEDDITYANLLVVGTPKDNKVLAKIADKLPLTWTAGGFKLGDYTVEGPGVGACMIFPNPLNAQRYVVIITATDEAGYQVWDARSPGGDYILGRVQTVDEKPKFIPTARGWFDNDWKYKKDLGWSAGK